jgi:hypothetical protein
MLRFRVGFVYDCRMKNKTVAAWLAFAGGPLGLHRFYLFGLSDRLGWLLMLPTALGLWGFDRVKEFGVDDVLSWWLIPIFGFAFAACALNAIVYGLMSVEQWNTRFNPHLSADAMPGRSNWFTIGAVAVALLVGTTVLMSSIVYSIQRYFEMQIEEAHQMSK